MEDLQVLNEIHWTLTDPTGHISYGYDEYDRRIPVPREVARKKLPIRTGDRVAILYSGTKPILSVPLIGNTIGDFFSSIHRGMGVRLKPGHEKIMALLREFREPESSELLERYRSGRLTPRDIVSGNYQYFEGGVKRMPNGVWVYNTGS